MGKTLTKFIIGIVVIGGALGYLIYNAMQSSWAYYIKVDEFAAKKTLAQDRTFRIAGIVEKETISRNLQKIQLTFKLKGEHTSLPVSYTGTVPDNFAEDREVVVEGRLDTNGVFQAKKLLTKCESKYKAKLDSDEGTKQESDKVTE